MKTGKIVTAALAAALFSGAAFAQSAPAGNNAPEPKGRMAGVLKLFDTNGDSALARDEFDGGKTKIFGEIDKNVDKQLSYDEVKAWSKSVRDQLASAGENATPPQPQGDTPPMGPGKKHMREHGMHEGGRQGQWHGYGKKHGMMMGGPRAGLAMMFMKADANDNGFVGQEEFNVFADRMFTRMDRNADSKVDTKDMPRFGMKRDFDPHGPKGGMMDKKQPNKG